MFAVGQHVAQVGVTGVPLWRIERIDGERITCVSIGQNHPWKGAKKVFAPDEIKVSVSKPLRPLF